MIMRFRGAMVYDKRGKWQYLVQSIQYQGWRGRSEKGEVGMYVFRGK